jgi:hypothetical protein
MCGGRENKMKQYLATVDRAAAQVNGLLVVIAIGLRMLDMTVLVSKGMMAAIAENMPTSQAQIAADGPFTSSKQGDRIATHP